jgi:hypothetical protein
LRYVKHLNDGLFLRLEPNMPGLLITPEDIADGEAKPRQVGHPYWSTPDSRALLTSLQALRRIDGLKNVEMYSEVATGVRDYLLQVSNWRASPTTGTNTDHFNQKSMLYTGIVKALPSGPTRDRVVDEYVSFLETTVPDHTSTVEWLYHVRNLLETIRGDPQISRLLASPNPTIRLYALLAGITDPGANGANP